MRRGLVSCIMAAAAVLLVLPVMTGGRDKLSSLVSIKDIEIDIPGETDKTILVVNDMHVLDMDPDINEKDRDTVILRKEAFKDSEGRYSEILWNELSGHLDEADADLIVFNGDMADFMSKTNAQILKAGFDKISTPFIYLRADHDMGEWYTSEKMTAAEARMLSAELAPMEEMFVKDMDGFLVLGWNDSTSQLGEEGLKRAGEALSDGRPVILFTHVPFDSSYSPDIRDFALSADPKGRSLLWGSASYYVPDETTSGLMSLIMEEDSNAAAVFGAHLHKDYEGMLTESIPEYILPPSFEGVITRIHVH